jgi:beta-lactamase regulating signal transducer with metallopeptidase domain/protocatechuate 3,4-dioxygenase beta subunit
MSNFSQYLARAVESPFAQFLLDAAIKATVLLAVAMVATSLLRRSSAAVRHRIWCLTFAALVLLPGLSAALPEWRLAVLPNRRPLAYSSPLAPREESRSSLAPQAERTIALQPSPLLASQSEPEALPLAEREDYGGSPRNVADQEVPPAIASTIVAESIRRPVDLAMLWLTGTLVALLPLIVGFMRTLIVRRRSRSIDDANWTSLLDDLRQRLALARRVGLYETASALMPMTWGVLRPVVMLPQQARDWTDRLRRIVLLHELAHVKRCDVAFQLLGRLVCALYWFHPLAWYALRRMRIERELACDDCVVLAGERATDYAAELVEIAHSYRSIPFAAAIAMAQRSSLEHRLRAMFDRACSHLPVGTRTARLLPVGVLALVTAIAVVRLSPRAAADEDKDADAVATGESSHTRSSANDGGKSHRLSGRVVDDKGRPVEQARVRILHVDSEMGTWTHRGRILAESRAEARGEFSIDYAPNSKFVAREHFTEPSRIVLADAPGYACDWHELQPDDQEIALTLSRDDVPLEGRVLDLEGRPIHGVRVSVERLTPAAKDLGDWIEAAKQNPVTLPEDWMAQPINSPKRRNAPKVARFPGRKSLWIAPTGFLPSAVTDENGNFKFTGLGRDRLVCLQLEGGAIAKTWLNAVTHEMPSVPYPQNDPRFRVPTCFGRRFDYTAEPEQPIAGVVRDADSGRPLPRVEVRLGQYADSLLLVEGFLAAVTDDEGRYTLRSVPKPHDPERNHRLRIVPPDGEPYFRTDVEVARHDGLEAVECDIPLKRAKWLRGRVTDAVTGKPILGLVEYYPFLSNKAAADYPNFVPGMHSVEGDRYPTRDDGIYQLPVLPGRGLVAFIAQHADRYPEADGADAIGGQADGREGNVYHLDSTELTTAVREVAVPADGGDFVCNIELKPLDVANIALLDPDGKPLRGAVVRRGAPIHIAGWPYEDVWSSEPLAETTDIVGPRDQFRTLFLLHRERQLAAAISLSPERDPPRQVVLRACGTVSGRIVDAKHNPLANLYLQINAAAPAGEHATGWARASFDRRHRLDSPRTNQDGKFRLELVPPDIAYVVRGNIGAATVQKTTPVLKPGQTLELGDLVLQTPEVGSAPEQKAVLAKPEVEPSRTSTSGIKGGQSSLHGAVLNSAGEPLAGANVDVRLAVFNTDDPPLGSTTSDAYGRFQVTFRWPESEERTGDKPDLLVVATADGLAPDWKYLREDEPPGDIALSLPEESAITGRIVNAEGRPLAGVELRGEAIVRYDGDTMKMVLDDVAQGRALLRTGKSWHYGALPKEAAQVTTAANGRFRISGLSANTVVKLHLWGAGIRETRLNATTAVGETVRGPVPPVEPPYGPRAGMVLYGSQFDYVAEPGRRIEGTVRDRETGMPVAKAKVMIYQPTAAVGGGYEVTAGVANDRLLAETDDAGRYVIDGCAKNSRVVLNVDPSADGPAYFPAALPIEDTPGLAEVTQNVDLVRGIELRGRIVDSETAQPLIASLEYAPLYLNKYAAPLYEQEANLRSQTRSAADGSFRLAVAPGPGAVAVSRPTAASQDYTSVRVSYEDVVKLFEASPSHHELAHSPDLKLGLPDSLRTQGRGGWSLISQTGHARMILVCPEEKKPPEPAEVRLVRGRRIQGKVVGPDGQPLAGARAYLNNPGIGYKSLSTAEFTLSALAPGEKRDIAFQHDERRLGAFRTISADETEPLIVPLAPCGSAQGRVLDEQSAPIAGLHVWFYRVGHNTSEASFAVTDADGRFRFDKLIPQQPYEVMRSGPGSTSYRQFSPQKLIFSIASGKTHELGDLTVKGPVQTVSQKKGTASAADDSNPPNSKKPGDSPAGAESRSNRTDHAIDVSSSQSTKDKIVRGRVLLPDGKPATGAELYWSEIKSPGTWGRPKAVRRGTTNDDGRFEITLSESDLPATSTLQALTARKSGYGLAWQRIQRKEIPGNITLQLAEDLPIRGRVMDTEGRPVSGAKISLISILASRNGNLDAFLLAWKHGWRDADFTKLDQPSEFYADFDPFNTVTDEEGRFEVFGAGVERVTAFEVTATGYAYDHFHVVTRQDFDAHAYNEAAGSHSPAAAIDHGMRLAGPQVERVMTAELIVRGKILTGDREPVAGARIHLLGNFCHTSGISTVTDVSGRYELRGCHRGLPVWLSIDGPERGQLLDRSLQRETTPTQAALDLDVELKRGVFIEGRVFDQANGEGARAVVTFVALPGNRFGALDNHDDPGMLSDDEGRFRLLVMPGPGVLTAAVNGGARIADHEFSRYRQASFSGEDSQRVPTTVNGDDRYFTARDNSVHLLTAENAVKFLDLAPDTKSVTCDLPVDRGKTVKIQIEDEQGEPVKDAFASGVVDAWPYTVRLVEPSCTIYGLGSDRPRRVCLLHSERRLAASIMLTGEEQEPVKVRLAASASISGRALAPDGQPLADALVQIHYAGNSARELQRYSRLDHAPIKTDGEGRFLADNIVPGERFSLDFKSGQMFYRAGERRELTAGEKLNLGEVTVQAVR